MVLKMTSQRCQYRYNLKTDNSMMNYGGLGPGRFCLIVAAMMY